MIHREIKFRVWNNDGNKKMEYVNLRSIYWDEGWDGKSVVMQYTGLKDKNGKEIYIGDILRKPSTKLVLHGEQKSWGNKYKIIKESIHGWNLAKDKSKWEVVGNIYQNPQLPK